MTHILAKRIFIASLILFLIYYEIYEKIEAIEKKAKSPDNLNISLRLYRTKKDFLYIGVMTSASYINSRILYILRTWARSSQMSKIMFFTGKNPKNILLDDQIIVLHGIDDSYPPQKKSFMMLNYMFKNEVQNFKWFARFDDDVFVNVDKLIDLLSSYDHNEDRYIGRIGHGLIRDRPSLGLNGGSYCMGGPGVLISWTLLNKIGPKIEECLNLTVSRHEDTEIGRCIKRISEIQCSSEMELKKLFLHEPKIQENWLDHHLHQDNRFLNAITVHPIRSESVMAKLQLFSLKTNTLTSLQNFANFKEFQKNYFNYGLPDIIDSCLAGTSVWSTFDSQREFDGKYREERRQISIKGKRLQTIHQFLISFAIKHSQLLTNPRQISEPTKIKLVSGTSCANLRRIYYIFSVKLWNKTSPHQQNLYTFHLEQTHATPFKKILKTSISSKMINIIVGIRKRMDALKRFMIHFMKIQAVDKNIRLILVVYSDSQAENSSLKSYFKTFEFANLLQRGIMTIHILQTQFSRSSALNFGMNKVKNRKALVFLSDIDLIFDHGFLLRCRRFAQFNVQAYFPIVTSQYEKIMTYGNDGFGFWRTFGYGAVCAYREDINNVGNFDETITEWGHEDVDLYEKIIRQKSINVIRSPDPGIIHLFHSHECNSQSSMYQKCISSSLRQAGSKAFLFSRLINTTWKR